MNMEQIIRYIEERYPDLDWLVRRNRNEENYFANIYGEGMNLPNYGETPLDALQKSLNELGKSKELKTNQ